MSKQGLSFLLGSAFFAASAMDNAVAGNKEQDPIHKGRYSLSTILTGGISKNKNIRDEIRPQIIDFEGRGPHFLRVYEFGRQCFFCACQIYIDAVDRKTNDVTNLVESFPTLSSKDTIEEGVSYSWTHLLSTSTTSNFVKYTFKAESCDIMWWPKNTSDNFVLKVTQDLSNWPGFKNSQAPKTIDPQDYGSAIQWRWDKHSRREILVDSDDITISRGSPVQISTELQKSRQIAFERGSNLSGSFGASAGIDWLKFDAALSAGMFKSFEEQFGISRGKMYTITLDPASCEKWRVNTYETIQTGHFSAPALGMDEERPIHYPVSQRLEQINLCKPPGTSEQPPVDLLQKDPRPEAPAF